MLNQSECLIEHPQPMYAEHILVFIAAKNELRLEYLCYFLKCFLYDLQFFLETKGRTEKQNEKKSCNLVLNYIFTWKTNVSTFSGEFQANMSYGMHSRDAQLSVKQASSCMTF